LQSPDSLSFGRLLPDAFRPFIIGFSEITILNVCSHREQSFRRQNQHDGEGREAAKSGRKAFFNERRLRARKGSNPEIGGSLNSH
jgi:hypothetical protein